MSENATAILLKPPNWAISSPANSGPRKATKRGALNANAIPVARMRVGNNSGSHTAIHEYWPSVKKPLIAATTSNRFRSVTHMYSAYVITSAPAKKIITIGLRPNRSARKPRPI
jgi:hypothetical protein